MLRGCAINSRISRPKILICLSIQANWSRTPSGHPSYGEDHNPRSQPESADKLCIRPHKRPDENAHVHEGTQNQERVEVGSADLHAEHATVAVHVPNAGETPGDEEEAEHGEDAADNDGDDAGTVGRP
jgi:hypothetical protein